MLLGIMSAVTTWITQALPKCNSNLYRSTWRKGHFGGLFHLLVGRKGASMDLWLTATERNMPYGSSGVEGN